VRGRNAALQPRFQIDFKLSLICPSVQAGLRGPFRAGNHAAEARGLPPTASQVSTLRADPTPRHNEALDPDPPGVARGVGCLPKADEIAPDPAARSDLR